MKVFVVEDEVLISMMVEGMLEDLGHSIAGVATHLSEARRLAETIDADLAILDININGERSFPAAEILSQRGIGVLFASGYGALGLEPPFLDACIVKKPFDIAELETAIARVTSAG